MSWLPRYGSVISTGIMILAAGLNMDAARLEQFLWNRYHPSNIWFLFTGIAVLGSLLLLLYDRFVISRK